MFSASNDLLSHLEDAHLSLCSFPTGADVGFSTDFIDMQNENSKRSGATTTTKNVLQKVNPPKNTDTSSYSGKKQAKAEKQQVSKICQVGLSFSSSVCLASDTQTFGAVVEFLAQEQTVPERVYFGGCHGQRVEVNRAGFVGTTQFQNGYLSSGGTHSSAC